MSPNLFLGEFEQMVLLAILQSADSAFALEVRAEIERSADRSVSRGAFYTTLDRLEKKGFLVWSEAVPDDGRTEKPLRQYAVTPAGLEGLRASRAALMNLWRDLDGLLEHA
jgi:DNA-binding PadR family transcriptional regulator